MVQNRINGTIAIIATADAVRRQNYGELETDITYAAAFGGGTAALETAEIGGSGIKGFWRAASGDEFDLAFRVPGDFDPSATSYLQYFYTLASSTVTSVDTVTFNATFSRHAYGGLGQRLADATLTTGISDQTSRTLGVGGTSVVGMMFSDQCYIKSSAPLASGRFMHFQLTPQTTCASDTELRVWKKVIFRYARTHL